MVRPAWPGPPENVESLDVCLPSSTCGSVKLCRPVTVETTSTNSSIGRSSGSVIRKKVCTGPAPSMRAASYSSPGTVCRPARKMIAL